MTAILTLIYCWLEEFFFSLTDWGLSIWDSLLSVADSTLATIGTAGLTLSVIPNQYAWVLGATGMSQALAIVASAMGTRFILQTTPFLSGSLLVWFPQSGSIDGVFGPRNQRIYGIPTRLLR